MGKMGRKFHEFIDRDSLRLLATSEQIRHTIPSPLTFSYQLIL
jgi:hypothetical protein